MLFRKFFWIFQGFKQEILKWFKKRRQIIRNGNGRIRREWGEELCEISKGEVVNVIDAYRGSGGGGGVEGVCIFPGISH